jgi:hypothetical protein
MIYKKLFLGLFFTLSLAFTQTNQTAKPPSPKPKLSPPVREKASILGKPNKYNGKSEWFQGEWRFHFVNENGNADATYNNHLFKVAISGDAALSVMFSSFGNGWEEGQNSIISTGCLQFQIPQSIRSGIRMTEKGIHNEYQTFMKTYTACPNPEDLTLLNISFTDSRREHVGTAYRINDPSNPETISWGQAKKQNTTDAYKLFLEKYYSGRFSSEAEKRIEEITDHGTYPNVIEGQIDFNNIKSAEDMANKVILLKNKAGNTIKIRLKKGIDPPGHWHPEEARNFLLSLGVDQDIKPSPLENGIYKVYGRLIGSEMIAEKFKMVRLD